jgi:hypothetical protein
MIPEERIRKVAVRFEQITAGAVGLYGLDSDGGVWRYYPAVKENGKVKKFSGWYRLTSLGYDATGPSGNSEDLSGEWRDEYKMARGLK